MADINQEVRVSARFRISGLFSRIKGLLFAPKEEWNLIEKEYPAFGGLFLYAFILSLIPAIFIYLYNTILLSDDIFTRLAGGFWIIVQAGSNAATSLLSVYFISIVLNKLAPFFKSEKNTGRSFQVVVYSMTPYWISAIIYCLPGKAGYFLIPAVGYSLYLLYCGLPVTMRTPRQKRIIYLVVVFTVMITLGSVFFLVSKEIIDLLIESGTETSLKNRMF